MAKCLVLLVALALLGFVTLHVSSTRHILDNEVLDQEVPNSEGPPLPPLLGNTRGSDTVVPELPQDFKVVGLVFFGRRSRVEILDCYLKVCHFLEVFFPMEAS